MKVSTFFWVIISKRGDVSSTEEKAVQSPKDIPVGVAFAATCYGAFALFKRWIPDDLFLGGHFMLFDFDEPLAVFLVLSGHDGGFYMTGQYASWLLRPGISISGTAFARKCESI